MIYSHTSMYASQRRYHPSHHIHEVSQCANEILHLSREVVQSGHLERKFMVFPLFMSGFISKTREERSEILELVGKLEEEDCVGRNVAATRQLLEMVNQRQAQRKAELRRQRNEGPRVEEWGEDEVEDVDWIGIIAESGLQVVDCRL